MNYLITGGAGFIGANFVKYLQMNFPKINIVVLDALTYAGNLKTLENELSKITFIHGSINDKELILSILKEHHINILINFAAESHVDRSIENPKVFLETNILGTHNLLECAKNAWKIDTDEQGYPIYKDNVKFIQVSTDEVYGSLDINYENGHKIELAPDIQIIAKDRNCIISYGQQFFTESTPLQTHSPYSSSKASADLIVQSYGDTYKFPYNITRCSNNYGAYHFPEKLIPLTIKNIIEGKDIPIYGKGLNVRDWLYVEDHCKAIQLVAEKGRIGEVYNIGGFNETQNHTIVELILSTIKELIDQNPQYKALIKHDRPIDSNFISYVKDRLGHDARYAIDPTKIVKELGWYPETTFQKGIKQTIIWYLENQDWVKDIVSGDYAEFYDLYYGKK